MTVNAAPRDAIGPSTILVRAREIVIRLSDEDEIGIEVHGERHVAPRVALLVLDAFASPRTVAEALADLPRSGTVREAELTACIEELAQHGVLVVPERRGAVGTRGWVKPTIHLSMLDDRARTGGFCEALRLLVQPTDVVVDVGTGTGVLATCAAMSGARHVYAVESSGIAEVAARVFAANGVADRVTLVRERSTGVTLPERATLLVTETIGNDPLDEQMLEIIADAKERLLVPGARIIPSAIEIFAIAVDIPRSVLERHVFTSRKIEGYRDAYGMDFSPLGAHRLSASEPVMVDARDVATWPLGPPVLLASVDLTSPFEASLVADVEMTVSRDTQYLGILLAFRATLAPGIVLSTLPDDFDPTNHWPHAMFPAFDCPTLAKGTTVAVRYRYERGTTTVGVALD